MQIQLQLMHKNSFSFDYNFTNLLITAANIRVATGKDDVWFTTVPTDFTGSSFTVTVTTDSNLYTKTVDLSDNDKFIFDRADIHTFAVTVVKAEKPKTYKLLTDAAELTVGDKFVLATKKYATSSALLMSKEATTDDKIKPTETVTISDGPQILESALAAGTAVFTVEAGAKVGSFAFKSEAGYLYGSYDEANSARKLGFKDSVDTESSWTVTLVDGVANLVNSHSGRYVSLRESMFDLWKSVESVYVYYSDGEPAPVAPAEPTVSSFTLTLPIEGATGGVDVGNTIFYTSSDNVVTVSSNGSWRVNGQNGNDWSGLWLGSGKKITVATKDGGSDYVITKVDIAAIEGGHVNFDKSLPWEGESGSVSFTASSASKVASITVYYSTK